MERLIIKTKLSFKLIILGIVTIIFFCGIISLIYGAWNASDKTNSNLIIILIFVAIILFFSIYTLIVILNLKTITLTKKSLIIKKPFLLQSKKISIENIKKISEKPILISLTTSDDVQNSIDIYKGKQIIIELYQGKTIKLSSIEIPEYDSLKNNLRKQIRKNNGILGQFENFNEPRYLLTIYLLVIVFITFGLIYAQIKKGI